MFSKLKTNPLAMFKQIKINNNILYLIFIISIFYMIMPRQFYNLYNSILGKLLAVIIVMILTSINIIIGVFSALLVMFLYDNLIEGMENKDDKSKPDVTKKSNEGDKHDKIMDAHEKINEVKEKHADDKEKMPEINDAVASFKKNHCLNGKLVKNNMEEIKLSDIQSYFPQISFGLEHNSVCNPCEPSCNFKMTSYDERITVEEKLRPKDTNSVSVS